MKVRSVPSLWLNQEGRRLDCGPYLSGAIEAKALLEKLPVRKAPLQEVTQGGKAGIFNGPQFVRNYVDDPRYGVPFLTSGMMLLADLSHVSLLSRRDAESVKLRHLRISEGMTLITCSGTIGRMAYARPEMEGMWSSQDILKVVPDPDKIPPGYLYAFLSSRFGVPLVVGGTYGAIIQHIEPVHIADLPVPLFGDDVAATVHRKISEATWLRDEFRGLLNQATDSLFSAVGLKDISDWEWHTNGPDLGFTQYLNSPESLRALNFNSRLQTLQSKLESVPHLTLGEICRDGELRSGIRFKRIDCEPEFGVKLIGQRELFWLQPEGRWISPAFAPKDIFVDDETIVVASQGTLGENEVFCRGELITGPWVKHAYTQHLLRIRSGLQEVATAFLFAFIRSETAFRYLRSISIGSKQQDIHRTMLAGLPVPIPPEDCRNNITEMIRKAYRLRHMAADLELEAIRIVERAINS